MADTPVIQHWLVSVARSQELEGADTLDIASDTDPAGAWDLATMTLGVDAEGLAESVARHYGLQRADLDDVDVHAAKLLPNRVARKLNVIPLRYSDRELVVATADPVSMEAERELQHVAGRTIHFEVAPPSTLQEAVAETYPPEERHEIPPISHEARGGPHVLVVDDDADMRLLLRTVLEKNGFRVAEADDGITALETLRESEDPFDLVTLDLHMEEMHGLEVLKTMRARLPTSDIPVVVATASDDPDVEMELFNAGADDYVVKPVDPPRFVLRIQAVLRRRRGASSLGDLGSFF